MTLFPSIGAEERKKYLKFGRERAEGRMQRQQKQISNYMCKEQQWIPLNGPGGRLPTEDDADDEGQVYFLPNRVCERGHFQNVLSASTHWAPIPKAPPLPKPVELTQAQKDEAKALSLIKEWHGSEKTTEWLVISAIRYGRSDGRAALAREALGLFEKPSINLLEIADIIADEVESINWKASEKAVVSLHTLLTKAAEEKP